MPIDVRMPDGTVISNVPDDVTQEDLTSLYGQYTGTNSPEPKDVSSTSLPEKLISKVPYVGNALNQGMFQLGGDVVEGIPAFARAVFGNTEEAQKGLDRLKKVNDLVAQQYPLNQPLPQELGSWEDLGQIFKAAPEQFAKMFPSLVTMFAGGEAAGIPGVMAAAYPQTAVGNLQEYGADKSLKAGAYAVPETLANLIPVAKVLEKTGGSALNKAVETGVAGVVGNTLGTGIHQIGRSEALDQPLFTKENAAELASSAITGAGFAPLGAAEGYLQNRAIDKTQVKLNPEDSLPVEDLPEQPTKPAETPVPQQQTPQPETVQPAPVVDEFGRVNKTETPDVITPPFNEEQLKARPGEKRSETLFESKKPKQEYKPLYKPDKITHDFTEPSVTGETTGKVNTLDAKNKPTGSIFYRIEPTGENGNKMLVEGMTLEPKGARQRQDTAFALLSSMKKVADSKGLEDFEVTGDLAPYKTAFDSYTKDQAVKEQAKIEPPKPTISDVKEKPIFSKSTLPNLSKPVQNFFDGLPKAVSNKVPVVASILSNNKVQEGKQAYQNPSLFGLSPEDVKTLNENKPALARMLSDNYFQGADLKSLMNVTPSELVGNAYNAFNELARRGATPFETNLPDKVAKVFEKLASKSNALRTELNQNGVNLPSDIYYLPAHFPSDISIDNVIRNGINEMDVQDNLTHLDKLKGNDDLQRVSFNPGKISNWLTGTLSWINPVTNAARNSEAVGYVQDSAISRRDNMYRLQSKLMHMLEPALAKYGSNGDKRFTAMSSVLEHNRLSGFNGFIDKDGFYNYKDSRDGKLKRVTDKDQSQAIMNIKNVMRTMLEEDKRVNMNHPQTQKLLREAGLGLSPNYYQVKHVIDSFGDRMKPSTKKSLEGIRDYLQYVNNLLSRDYVPFKRQGDHGITIKKVNPETGEKELEAFVSFFTDKSGNPVNDNNWKNAQEIIKEYENDPNFEVGGQFELTKDRLLSQIPNKEMTLDIIDQLVDIMIRDGEKINGVNPDGVPTWEAIGSILRNDVTKRGFEAAMKESKNIKGYRKNWENIIPHHIQVGAYALSNKRYSPILRQKARQVQQSGASAEEKAYVNRYVDSIMTPDPDMYKTLRTLQFNWVLGFRPMSAIIQITNFAHTIPATLTMINGSPLKSFGIMTKAMYDTASFMKLTPNSFYEISPKTLAKTGWSDDKKRFIQNLYQKSYLTQTLSSEEIGASPYETSTWQGKLGKGAENFTRIGGMLLRSTEEVSRLTTAAALYDAMQDPKALNNFHNLVLKDDAQYRQHMIEQGRVEPDKEYLAKYGLSNALALFGKEGRAPFQSTAAQFLAPFSTYNWQMFLNMYRMARKMGPEGRKAAALATLGIISTAGIWGLPGFMILKEGLEAAMSLVFKEDIDLDNEMNTFAEHVGEINPFISSEQALKMAGLLQRGAISTYSNVDVNERTGFQPLGQAQILATKNQLVSALGGKAPTARPTDMYGVVGGTLAMAPFNAISKYVDSGGDWSQAMMQLMPQAVKDVYQANVVEPYSGKQYAGETIISPKDANTFENRLIGSIGGTSAKEGMNLEKAKLKDFQANKISMFKNIYAKNLRRYYIQWANAMSRGEDATEIKESLDKAMRDYANYLASKNMPGNDIVSSIRSITQAAVQEGMGANDEKINQYFKLKSSANYAKKAIMDVDKQYKIMMEDEGEE